MTGRIREGSKIKTGPINAIDHTPADTDDSPSFPGI